MELGVLVLAGGGGKRFGGEKAFFELRGKPMVQHVVDEVSKLPGELVISCGQDAEKLSEMFPGAMVVPDREDRSGALTGLVSALPEILSEYVALVTCDCPGVKSEVLERLAESASEHDAAIPKWPSDYLEPLQAVYRTAALREAAERAWKEERMRLVEVIDMLEDVVWVPTEELREVDPELKSFLNVNSPDEVEKFR